jgi:hypothetical protein
LETINENMPLNGGLYLTLSTFGGLRFLHLLQQEWMMGKRSRPTFDDQDAMFAAAKKYGCHRQYPSMGYSCLPDAAFTFEYAVVSGRVEELMTLPHSTESSSNDSPMR